MKRTLLSLTLVLLSALGSWAQTTAKYVFYFIGDGMGSNEPIPPQDSTPVALRAEVDENWPPPRFEPVTYKAMSARRLSYAGQIMRIANANGVEVELAHAIITQESKYKADERSPAGAMGLMQLMPGAARRWECSDAQRRQWLDEYHAIQCIGLP